MFDFNISPFQTDPAQFRLWHKGKYNRIASILSDVDWDSELNHRDSVVDRLVDLRWGVNNRLIEILQPLIDDYICPACHSLPPRSSPRLPWKTNPPRSLKNRRREAWGRVKSSCQRFGTNSSANKLATSDFFNINKVLKSFTAESQSAYEQDLIRPGSSKRPQSVFTPTSDARKWDVPVSDPYVSLTVL